MPLFRRRQAEADPGATDGLGRVEFPERQGGGVVGVAVLVLLYLLFKVWRRI